MLNKLRNTLKHSIIYSFGNLSTKIVGLILLPLYTSELTSAEYGILSLLEVTSQLLTVIVGLRMATALLRFGAAEKQIDKQKSIIFISFVMTLVSVVIMNLLLHPFASNFSNLFFDHNNYSNYFHILFLWSSFEIFNKLFLSYLRIDNRSVFYIIIVILKVALVLGLNIYFIAFRHMGVEGVILSQLIGSALVFLVILPKIIGSMRFHIDRKLGIEMLRYGVPLIFAGISMLLLTVGDRYLLKYFLSYSEVGIYSLGYKIAGVINMLLIQSFQLGFMPIAFKMFDQPGAKRFYSKILTYYTFILILGALALSFFSREVLLLMADKPEYYVAHAVVPIISLAFILKGMQFVFSIGMHYAKKMKYNAYIITFSVVFSFGLSIILIPIIGYYGAAISAVLSNLLLAILFYKYSQKFYTIPFELKKIGLLFIIGGGIYATSWFTVNLGIVYALVIKFILLVLFPVLLYVFKFYDVQELRAMKGFVRKWKKTGEWKNNIYKMSGRKTE
ncbi:MAG: oligosaccharide flippase family protein [Salinivirgaceae bacterium]